MANPILVSTSATKTVAASGGDYTSLQAAFDDYSDKFLESDVVITFKVAHGLYNYTDTILKISHPQANQFKILGEPESITEDDFIRGIASSGHAKGGTWEAGNFQYVLQLDSGSDLSIIEAGMVCNIPSVQPNTPLRNVFREVIGNPRLAVDTSGSTADITVSGNFSLSVSGNDLQVTNGSDTETVLSVGDMVMCRGQARIVASLDSMNPEVVTFDSGFDDNDQDTFWGTDEIHWFAISCYGTSSDTITTSGTEVSTITGLPSNIGDDLEKGMLLIANGDVRRVITDPVQTVSQSTYEVDIDPPLALTGDHRYAILPLTQHLLGAFEIVSVDDANDTVTIKITSRDGNFPPPTKGISDGFAFFPTTLSTNAGNGIEINGVNFGAPGADFNGISKIAIIGTEDAETGFAVAGDYSVSVGSMLCESTTAIVGFDVGVDVGIGCALNVRNVTMSHSTLSATTGLAVGGAMSGQGIFSDGGSVLARYSRINGCYLAGVSMIGGQLGLADTTLCGNRNQGILITNGASVNLERMVSVANRLDGFKSQSGAGSSATDLISLSNGTTGISFSRGSGARFPGSLFWANASHGIVSTAADIEAGTTWSSGNAGDGVQISGSQFEFDEGASTGNAGHGVSNTDGGTVRFDKGAVMRNGTDSTDSAIFVSERATISAPDAIVSDNSNDDYEATLGGTMFVTNSIPSLPAPANKMRDDTSLIYDSSLNISALQDIVWELVGEATVASGVLEITDIAGSDYDMLLVQACNIRSASDDDLDLNLQVFTNDSATPFTTSGSYAYQITDIASDAGTFASVDSNSATECVLATGFGVSSTDNCNGQIFISFPGPSVRLRTITSNFQTRNGSKVRIQNGGGSIQLASSSDEITGVKLFGTGTSPNLSTASTTKMVIYGLKS